MLLRLAFVVVLVAGFVPGATADGPQRDLAAESCDGLFPFTDCILDNVYDSIPGSWSGCKQYVTKPQECGQWDP